MPAITFDYRDIQKFERTCRTFGDKTADNAAKKAAQKGSNVVGKQVRIEAPVGKTGELHNGFIKRKERSRLKGKHVYDYKLDRAKNSIFQKPIIRPGLYGGKNSKGYYPFSVEYGFLTKAPGGGYTYQKHIRGSNQYAQKTREAYRLPSRKVEGQHFMKKARDHADAKARAVMKQVLNTELDKAWRI